MEDQQQIKRKKGFILYTRETERVIFFYATIFMAVVGICMKLF